MNLYQNNNNNSGDFNDAVDNKPGCKIQRKYARQSKQQRNLSFFFVMVVGMLIYCPQIFIKRYKSGLTSSFVVGNFNSTSGDKLDINSLYLFLKCYRLRLLRSLGDVTVLLSGMTHAVHHMHV